MLVVAGLSPSILFDWSLPLLRCEVQPHPGVSSQFLALLALREGLSSVDAETAKRWAGAIFEMCEQLLDSEDTSPHLLQLLLGVLTQVDSRRKSSLCSAIRRVHPLHASKYLVPGQRFWLRSPSQTSFSQIKRCCAILAVTC